PGGRDAETLPRAIEFLFTVVADPAVRELGLGGVEVVTEAGTWTIGEGAGGGTLKVDAFELFRALTGRRSADQIRGDEWGTDTDPYLSVFQRGPFHMRTEALVE